MQRHLSRSGDVGSGRASAPGRVNASRPSGKMRARARLKRGIAREWRSLRCCASSSDEANAIRQPTQSASSHKWWLLLQP